jgi:tRNA-specific 2-thiouridylase
MSEHLTGARVAVALSGGVDSAMAAFLLRRRGLEVVGVHLRLVPETPCPPLLPELAAALDIPLEIVDLRGEFTALVVEPFVRRYLAGFTPNPCVVCNAAIKFGVLWERVRAWGFTHLATGHYVRLARTAAGDLGLFRGVDRSKDQAYFLHRLPRELLPHLVFPLGGLTKDQVRRRYREAGLPPLPASESQDLCFIPRGNYREFLRSRGWQDEPGKLVDRRGRVLGRHQGVAGFTVGQRRGLGVPGPEPYYVLALKPECRRVVIGTRAELYASGLAARDPNWLVEPPPWGRPLTARLRYRHPGVSATVHAGAAGLLLVHFAAPQAAVTPGQAVAFYDGDRLLGGAWIEARID